MLAVNSEHIPQPINHASEEYQEEPSLGEVETAPLKQQEKKKLLNPLNILIIFAAFALIGLGSYYLISQSSPKDIQSKINESHGKIISYAGSSKESNTASSSSKSSSNNNKPNQRSAPAGKKVISSNSKLTGAGSPPNGDDEDDKDDNSEKKKSLSGGSSTDIDSDQQSEEDSLEQIEQDPKVWVDTKAPGVASGTPSVGATRDGN